MIHELFITFLADFQTNLSWHQLKKVMKNQSIKNYTQHLCLILLLVQICFGPKWLWSNQIILVVYKLDFSGPFWASSNYENWYVHITFFLSLQVSMQDLALSTLFEVVESHKFLTLPRLSSQGVMDQICPPESSKSRKKLCVVLVNRGKDVHTDPLEELKRSHLRSFIQVRLKLDPFWSILIHTGNIWSIHKWHQQRENKE